MKKLIAILKNIDRRVIYALMFVCVILPLLWPIGLPIKSSGPSLSLYQEMEKLKAGDKVVFSFDYDPGSLAEVEPMAVALVYHCFKKKVKVIAPALWPTGPLMATKVFNTVLEMEEGKGMKDGVDFVNLGFYPGPTVGLTQVSVLCADIRKAYPWDIKFRPVEQLPIMEGVNSLKDVKLVVSLSSGDPGIPAWVEMAQARFGIKVAGGATAVQAPQFYPYIQSRQLFGFLGGMRGAAEYEQLVGLSETHKAQAAASQGMDAQSTAHMLILALIVIANAMYLTEQKKK